MNDDQGSISAFLAVLALSLFVLVGLVVDGGRIVAAREEPFNVAEQAARTGANQVAVQNLRWSEVVADDTAADAAAERYVLDHGYRGSASTIDNTVTVTLSRSEPMVILGVIGVNQVQVAATASAAEVHGVTRAE